MTYSSPTRRNASSRSRSRRRWPPSGAMSLRTPGRLRPPRPAGRASRCAGRSGRTPAGCIRGWAGPPAWRRPDATRPPEVTMRSRRRTPSPCGTAGSRSRRQRRLVGEDLVDRDEVAVGRHVERRHGLEQGVSVPHQVADRPDGDRQRQSVRARAGHTAAGAPRRSRTRVWATIVESPMASVTGADCCPPGPSPSNHCPALPPQRRPTPSQPRPLGQSGCRLDDALLDTAGRTAGRDVQSAAGSPPGRASRLTAAWGRLSPDGSTRTGMIRPGRSSCHQVDDVPLTDASVSETRVRAQRPSTGRRGCRSMR